MSEERLHGCTEHKEAHNALGTYRNVLLSHASSQNFLHAAAVASVHVGRCWVLGCMAWEEVLEGPGLGIKTAPLSYPSLFFPSLFYLGRGTLELSPALPLSRRSYLGALLPESLLHVLESYGPAVFAAALSGDHATPELIWTHEMRGGRLVPLILQHLGE